MVVGIDPETQLPFQVLGPREPLLGSLPDIARPGKSMRWSAVISDGALGQHNDWCLVSVRAVDLAPLRDYPDIIDVFGFDGDGRDDTLDRRPRELGWNGNGNIRRLRTLLGDRGVVNPVIDPDQPLRRILQHLGDLIQPGWRPRDVWPSDDYGQQAGTPWAEDAIVFEDSFTEGADTTLASHTPSPTGTSWTKVESAAGKNLRVASASDTCEADGSGAGNTMYSATPGPTSADYDVLFTLAALETSNNPYSCGVMGRFADASNYYYGRVLPSLQANDKRIYKEIAGVQTSLGSGDNANTVSDVILLEMRGSTLRLLQNGVERVSVSDSALTAAGKGGLLWGGIAGDSTISTWRVDDFKVDEVVAAAGLVTRKTLLGVGI